MGIRIENNFWITKNGNIDLMKNIPITVGRDRAIDEEKIKIPLRNIPKT
jgi:Xaa-Pro aminopeptidase